MAANAGVGPFRPVAVGRTSDTIVAQLRASIRAGQLAVGERLPAERELCDQLGVSRLSLREALRVLESSGLIEIRMGARGGAFVTAPSADRAGAGLTDLVSTSGLSAAHVTEVRALIELGLVPLVVERATAEDIRELREACDRAAAAREHGSYTVEMSFAFHLRLAAASHNPAAAMIMESFREAVLMSMHEARHEGSQGVEEHRAVVAAIEDGDAELADRLLAEHLRRTADAVAG